MRVVPVALVVMAGLAAAAVAQPGDMAPYLRFVASGPARLTVEAPSAGLGTIDPLPPGRLTIEYGPR